VLSTELGSEKKAMPVNVKLTSHLLSLPTVRPYSAATEHTFLQQAGEGTLSKPLLSCFIAQDRLYAAHGYPKFIGHLLASIPFSSSHALKGKDETLHKHVVDIASLSLQNVVRESNFFVETGERFGLNLEEWRERKGTRDYLAEMARFGGSGRMEDCVVFLWAMGKVYLDAWTNVKDWRSCSVLSKTEAYEPLELVVSNWSSREFVEFVDELANIVDSLDITPESESWLRAEEIWGRVIELEEAFWPGEEELAFLKG